MDLFAYAATATYEGYAEVPQFRISDDPVIILGKQYSTKYDMQEMLQDISSRLWFTYRKGYHPIGGSSGPTSDTGWGCMLRCGQMMLGHALLLRHFSRDWRWDQDNEEDDYFKILQLFADKRISTFSIHQIAAMGVVEGKQIGQWFGPNTVAQVLKKLCVFDGWSNLRIHVAMDSMLIVDEIYALCSKNDSSASVPVEEQASNISWNPVLIVVPLRLGLADVSDQYFSALKYALSVPSSCGIIGGRPNHAHWFIGYVGDSLVYLDPHTTQAVAEPVRGQSTHSYHCAAAGQMPFSSLDPSVALGFYCGTEASFVQLCVQLRKHVTCSASSTASSSHSPLFELQQSRPRGWWSSEMEEGAAAFTVHGSGSDDEFVIV